MVVFGPGRVGCTEPQSIDGPGGPTRFDPGAISIGPGHHELFTPMQCHDNARGTGGPTGVGAHLGQIEDATPHALQAPPVDSIVGDRGNKG
jgi:hypothetical protein